MLAKRIIACLDVLEGRVVKGTRFKNHEDVGGILDLAIRYRDQGVDELVFYDIAASADGRRVSADWVTQVAKVLNIPFCVAGGIRSEEDAAEILLSGADKISINSPALENPELITRLARRFGQQCVVVGIDSILEEGDYRVRSHTGRETTIRRTQRKTMEWIHEIQERGAGEIVLNCMDRDGTGTGFDLEQLSLARKGLSLPLVASGGARCVEDFERVFRIAQVDAALGARAVHKQTLAIPALKKKLSETGIEMRL
jgi:cyclase